RLLAFTVDKTGAERYLLVVKDLATGRMLADTITHVNYALAWGNDNRTVFYGNSDAATRPSEIVRHVLGAPQSSDVVVVHEADPLFNLGLAKTKDHAYLLVTDRSFDAADVRYLPAALPAEPFRTLVPRRDSVLVTEVEHRGKEFLVLTND